MASNDTYQGAVRRYDPNGYLRHLTAGAVAAGGIAFASGILAMPRRDAAAIAAGVAVLLGIGKEVYDAATGRGHVDWLDAVFTALGGAVVAGAVLALR